jgi:hypothetical protein
VTNDSRYIRGNAKSRMLSGTKKWTKREGTRYSVFLFLFLGVLGKTERREGWMTGLSMLNLKMTFISILLRPDT